MKTKKIYIIRHGQTDYNKKGVVQGSGIDAPLNDTGRKQAVAFYEAYKDIEFDRIYTSSLMRTQQTVQPFIENGLKHTKLSGFNEINWGVHEGRPMNAEANNYYAAMVEKWNLGEVELPIEGGESPLDVQKRARLAMQEVMSNSDEKNVLICMHGRSMRILLATLLGYPLSKMDIFPHYNTGCYLLNYSDNKFTVLKHNDCDHLNGMA